LIRPLSSRQGTVQSNGFFNDIVLTIEHMIIKNIDGKVMKEKLINKSYHIETEEMKQENMEFIIIHRKPVEVNVKSIEEELYHIFKRYE